MSTFGLVTRDHAVPFQCSIQDPARREGAESVLGSDRQDLLERDDGIWFDPDH